MRLIDADALKEVMIDVLEHIKQNPKMDGQERHIIAAIATLSEMIDDAPTVDAVEVVRCGECKYLMPDGYCTMFADDRIRPSSSDFCSAGERKDGEQE